MRTSDALLSLFAFFGLTLAWTAVIILAREIEDWRDRRAMRRWTAAYQREAGGRR